MQQGTEQERVEQDKRLKERMSIIKYKVFIISGKGGVGKTTAAVNLAYGLGIKGYKVGILDVDIHGPNVAKMLGIEDKKLVSSELGIDPIEVLPNLKAVGPDTPLSISSKTKTSVLSMIFALLNLPNSM